MRIIRKRLTLYLNYEPKDEFRSVLWEEVPSDIFAQIAHFLFEP